MRTVTERPGEAVLRRNFLEVAWVILLLAVSATFACHYIYANKLTGPPIRSDGYGYYAYLPAVFIDHDLSLKSARENLYGGTLYEHGIAQVAGTDRYIDKYAIGTAVMQAPFFLIAKKAARKLGYPKDGYSQPFQIANMASAIFYLCLGAFFTYCSCRSRFSRMVSTATVLLLVFGTNVFHYATYDSSFSHVYQFALMSMLLWLGIRYLADADRRTKTCVALGFVVGMIALTRLTNIIAIMFPVILIASQWMEDRDYKRAALHLGIVGVLCAVVVLPQLLYLHSVAGRWILNSYAVTGEAATFNWTHPELLNFMFSIRKGFFMWSPVLLAAAVGLIFAFAKHRALFTASAVVVAIHIYLCASWYYWSFGGSYGSRPIIDIIPLLAIPLAAAIAKSAQNRRSTLVAVTAMLLIAVNMTLMYAYWRTYVPFDGSNWKTITDLPAKLLQ